MSTNPKENCLMDASIEELFGSNCNITTQNITTPSTINPFEPKSKAEHHEEATDLKILKIKQEIERLESLKTTNNLQILTTNAKKLDGMSTNEISNFIPQTINVENKSSEIIGDLSHKYDTSDLFNTNSKALVEHPIYESLIDAFNKNLKVKQDCNTSDTVYQTISSERSFENFNAQSKNQLQNKIVDNDVLSATNKIETNDCFSEQQSAINQKLAKMNFKISDNKEHSNITEKVEKNLEQEYLKLLDDVNFNNENIPNKENRNLEDKSNSVNVDGNFLKLELEYRKLLEQNNSSNTINSPAVNNLPQQYLQIFNDANLQKENIQNWNLPNLSSNISVDKLDLEYRKLVEIQNQNYSSTKTKNHLADNQSYDLLLKEYEKLNIEMENKKRDMKIHNNSNSSQDNTIKRLFQDLEAMKNELEVLSNTKSETQGKNRGAIPKSKSAQKNNFVLKSNKWKTVCCLCNKIVLPTTGILIKKCQHIGCRPCFVTYVKNFPTGRIICPYTKQNYHCSAYLEGYEIKLIRDLEQAVGNNNNNDEIIEGEGIYKCKTPHCTGIWITDGSSNIYACPLCNKYNCINCNAVHSGQTCEEYKRNPKLLLKNANSTNNWKCEESKTNLITQIITSADEWECSFCSFLNHTRNICEMCSKSRILYMTV